LGHGIGLFGRLLLVGLRFGCRNGSGLVGVEMVVDAVELLDPTHGL